MPRDPSEDRDALVEIRAGAGGDEASLFSVELLRMFQRLAERRKWKAEVIESSPSEVGGFKEVILRVSGDEVFRFLKYESGVHRVQRVPTTETQGRIHTSTVTVAVLPAIAAAPLAAIHYGTHRVRPLAMLMSLVVAFTLTPWMSYNILKSEYGKEEKAWELEKSLIYRLYQRVLPPFMN